MMDDVKLITTLILYLWFAYYGGKGIEDKNYKWASAAYAFSLFWFVVLILIVVRLVGLWEH